MTTRLNKRIKDAIIRKAVVKAGIGDRRDELKQRRIDWIEKVRVQSIGGIENDRKMKAIVKRFEKATVDLPEDIIDGNLFNRDYDIYINVAGFAVYGYFNGNVGSCGLSKDFVYKLTPHKATIEAGDPLADEFHDIENDGNDLDDDESKIKANVEGVLSTTTTIKKLLEIWPECKELLPDDLSPVTANLPMVQTEDLNKMIGLPS
jgi:hypothetical protein